MGVWTVVLKPISDNPTSGLAVFLTDGEEEREMSRVAFQRRNSLHAKTGLAQQLENEMARADEAAAIVNELQEECERLQRDATRRARERITELLGQPSEEMN